MTHAITRTGTVASEPTTNDLALAAQYERATRHDESVSFIPFGPPNEPPLLNGQSPSINQDELALVASSETRPEKPARPASPASDVALLSTLPSTRSVMDFGFDVTRTLLRVPKI
jgi:hypothetical protein